MSMTCRSTERCSPATLTLDLQNIPQKSIANALAGQSSVKKAYGLFGRDRQPARQAAGDGFFCKWELPASLPRKSSDRSSLNGSDRKLSGRLTNSRRASSENRRKEGPADAGKVAGKLPEPKLFDGKQFIRNPYPRPALKLHSPSNMMVCLDDGLPRHKAFLFEKTPVKNQSRSSYEGRKLYSKEFPVVTYGSSVKKVTAETIFPSRYRQDSSSGNRRETSPNRNTRRNGVIKSYASTGKMMPGSLNAAAAAATVGRRNSSVYAAGTSSRKSWDHMPVAFPRQSWDNLVSEHSSSSKATPKQSPVIGSQKQTATAAAAQHASLQARRASVEQITPAFQLESPSPAVRQLPIIYDSRWTDGSVSWDSISSTLAGLAKDVMRLKNSASLAAALALQEASAAESVIKNVSVFAEMRSLSRPEFPRESMEKYFNFCSSLRQATTVSDALAKSCQQDKLPSGRLALPNKSDEAPNYFTESRRSAASWIAAALSTDLASASSANKPLSGFDSADTKVSRRKSECVLGSIGNSQVPETIRNSQSFMPKGFSPLPSPRRPLLQQPSPSRAQGRMNTPMTSKMSVRRQTDEHGSRLFSPSKAKVVAPQHASSGMLSEKDALEIVSRFANGLQFKENTISQDSWVQGRTVEGILELAKQLQNESQKWFFKYMEEALNCGFQFNRVLGSKGAIGTIRKTRRDGEALAFAFPHLKQVNDWIGQLDYDTLDSNMLEVLDRLKKKICEFLLQHVETSSTTLRQSF